MVLDIHLQQFFIAYSPILVRRWSIFVVVPLCLTIFLSLGLLRAGELKNLDAEEVHTPDLAPSKLEKSTLNELWPLNIDEFLPQRSFNYKRFLMVLITAEGCTGNVPYGTPECNLLSNHTLENINSTYLDLIEDLEDYIATNITITAKNSTNYIYKDLCLAWWGDCIRTTNFIRMLRKRDELRDHGIPMTYPTANSQVTPIYLAHGIGGVTVQNGTQEIESVMSIRLTYFMRSDTDEFDELSSEFQDAASDYLQRKHNHLDLVHYHSKSIAQGLLRQNAAVLPHFATSIGLLLFFSTICCLRFKSGGINWVTSKTPLAAAGVLTACMGIASGFGLMMLLGCYRSGLTVVVPFLIIAIGVDDMFIMVAAWHQHPDSRLSLNERVSLALKEAAVAITITSVTDAMSFAVGTFSSIPSVRWFCLYASACIIFNYLYQITFFAAIMTRMGKWELEGRNSIIPCKRANNTSPTILPGISHKNGYIKHEISNKQRIKKRNLNGEAFFERIYGPLLMKPVTKCIVIIALIAYLSTSVYGLFFLEEGMEMKELLLKSDPTTLYMQVLADYYKDGWQCEIYVTKPPNISRAIVRDEIMDMLRKPLQFQKIWKQDLAWEDNENEFKLKAFRFRIGLSFDWNDLFNEVLVVNDLRRIASKYEKWGVTTYGGYIWKHVDQYDMVMPTTIQNVSIALICMVIVSLLLIPNPICTVWITLTIISIDLGVVGFMTLWGVSLSQISMITIIMSIGFSVDFAAHITYGYISSSYDYSDDARTICALQRLGWPLFQAGLSTILGVSVLTTVESDMVLIFFKTIILVIGFGMLHALVFLPVLLSVIMPLIAGCGMPCNSNSKSKKTELGKNIVNQSQHPHQNGKNSHEER